MWNQAALLHLEAHVHGDTFHEVVVKLKFLANQTSFFSLLFEKYIHKYIVLNSKRFENVFVLYTETFITIFFLSKLSN